ncbi:tetratricopeptide repeat protein [Stanieria cyanosphaera]|nr:tetratricopeptide repeat protein [Stanieria cyanosphaera]
MIFRQFIFLRIQDSVASYDRAIEIKPDYVAFLVNRGNALYILKCYEEELASCDRGYK